MKGVLIAFVVVLLVAGAVSRTPTNRGLTPHERAVHRAELRREAASDRRRQAAFDRSVRRFRKELAASGAITGRIPGPLSCRYRLGGAKPDPRCTPGRTNPRVTQRTIDRTICVPGWTATVRPASAATAPLKLALLAAYGQPRRPEDYELDHLISLELGGAPSDVRNLWPEPHAGDHGAFGKDVVENRLRVLVCDRVISLREAQRRILRWPN